MANQSSGGVLLEDNGFHAREITGVITTPSGQPTTRQDVTFEYDFETFFHPYVGELIALLNQKGKLADLMDPDTLHRLTKTDFGTYYTANTKGTSAITGVPEKSVDVRSSGAYAMYNWELLFHLPLGVAVHLSKNQRFAEARRWFHLIFDPTCTAALVDPPARFWKFLAFRYPTLNDAMDLDAQLKLLSTPDNELDDPTKKTKQQLLDDYHDILHHPFQPHVVARTRPVAYQYSVVMKYLDNLIAAGDQLFAQFTVESLAEATLYYILASTILGERPQAVPPRGTIRPKSFAELNAPLLDANGQPVVENGKPVLGVDAMGNALVELEAQFPFNFLPQGASGDQGGTLLGIARTLYFTIPPNDKLLGYWDTVADRLFKIRNCMDIEGVVRPLPLFDPPLDPGLLVKAAAAGIDVSSIVTGALQPLGPVRCQVLIQKSLEIASEVRALGASLLAALEKGDAERLALLRQDNEIKLQKLTQDWKYLQWQHAQSSTEALLRTRESALEKYKYYIRLLGQQVDQNAPDTLVLDRRELTEDNFDDAFQALVGQYDKPITLQALPALKLAGDSSPANQSGATGAGSLYLISNEDAELNNHLPMMRDGRTAAAALNTIAAVVTLIPEFHLKAAFWGLGAGAKIFGGSKLADELKIGADIAQTVATWAQDQAQMDSKAAGYQRRADDWMLQANLAAHDLMQIGRQLLTSLVAEQVAHRDYLNTQTQIAQSESVQTFLEDKFTNDELYGWMQGEVSRLFYAYYRFAVDTARRAERTMKQELMRPEVENTDYIQFNYWDAGRKGLLSGEALQLDVKRMEMAYLDNNRRELEITRHVSLRQLDPVALLSLKLLGRCEVTIPEWLYDLDCPGLYMRRIKSVALSLPSVVGPYTPLNCTLTLLRSKIRKKPDATTPYLPDDPNADDERFVQYVGAAQAIVTSTGTSDAGLFETNLRDERFLPFEGAGAISTWRLELPKDYPAFDYSTISDAIIHVRYTARQGGEPLANVARKSLTDSIGDTTQSPLALLFSLRHDFPVEWSTFANTGATTFSAVIKRSYFPYFTQGKKLSIDKLELYVDPSQPITPSTSTDDLTTALSKGDATLVLDKVPHAPAANVFVILRYSTS